MSDSGNIPWKVGAGKQGIAAMRFKSKGGTRPDDVGGAPAYWGMSEREYREKADVWPANPNGELTSWAIVESKEGLSKVREIAAEGVKRVAETLKYAIGEAQAAEKEEGLKRLRENIDRTRKAIQQAQMQVDSLERTAKALDALSGRQAAEPRTESWETTNLHAVATAIAAAAALREETRGGHWREDFPDTEESWRAHLDVTLNEGTPTVTYTQHAAPRLEGIGGVRQGRNLKGHRAFLLCSSDSLLTLPA